MALGGATLLLGVAVIRIGDFSLWRWVFEYAPGAGVIRSVGRVSVFLALPASVWLAWSCQQWLATYENWGASAKKGLAAVIVFIGWLVLAEQAGPPPSAGYSASFETKRVAQIVSGIPRTCEAFYFVPSPQTQESSAEWSLDAAWAALGSGVPTLHGYSGVEPPGWNLNGLKRPDFRDRVEVWIKRNGLHGPICEIQPKEILDIEQKRESPGP
jgi:hypothetical protein